MIAQRWWIRRRRGKQRRKKYENCFNSHDTRELRLWWRIIDARKWIRWDKSRHQYGYKERVGEVKRRNKKLSKEKIFHTDIHQGVRGDFIMKTRLLHLFLNGYFS